MLSLMVLLSPAYLAAQPGKKPLDSAQRAKMEELKKLRHDMYVKKLSLTETEEKGFFPIYDEYQLKLRESRREFRKKWKDKKPEDLSEEEATQYLSDAIALREKEVELFKTYSEKLKTVLPVKKIVILPRVEKEIQKELIGKFKDGRPPKNGKGKHKQGPPPPGPPPPPDED